ncbi:MAG: tRNA (guanosine(37)-N1)-methyltransferase TrmD [Patescibacteria group bacterium]
MEKVTFHILTLFPEMFLGPFNESILRRAQERGLVRIKIYNLRDFAADKHKTVDDAPYGGGPGMVLKVDVVDRALVKIKCQKGRLGGVEFRSILLTPQGRRFDQKKAEELSRLSDIILICGHYEGFDERIREHLVDEEISLGDFILSGGEVAAMAVVDAAARLVPGVLGKDESSAEESFSLRDEAGHPLLEYPTYTRPEEYRGWGVPEVLKSGNHAEIKKWRLAQALKRTQTKRPDLLR